MGPLKALPRTAAALVAVACVVSLALASAPRAPAADVVGIADQSAAMFSSPLFQALDVRVSRLLVSYDAVPRGTFEVADIDAWLAAARSAGIQPLIAFNHSRGCYENERILPRKRCRLPSVRRFRKAFRAFRQRYPDVAVYSPWNEINHLSQPTATRPDRAADFYNVVRRDCRGCTIVAADVIDQAGVVGYLKAFRRRAKGSPRLWGLHNYSDVNDFETDGVRRMLRTVRGEVWLTETGGIVRFGRRPFNPTRAAEATRHLFRIAKLSPRVTRLYIYNWSGVSRTARFDAGLTDAFGRARPAYRVVHGFLGRPGGNPQPPPAPPPPPPPPPEGRLEPTPTPSPTPTPTPTPCPTSPICL